MKNRSGFTLIAAIFIVLIVSLMAMVASSFIVSDAVITARNFRYLKAFYIAEAGSQYYLHELQNTPDWSVPPTTETIPFGGGCFVLSVNSSGTDNITFTVTGLVTSDGRTYSRSQRLGLTNITGLNAIAQNNALYWGGGSGGISTIGMNSTIEGNVNLNGWIDLNGATVNGDITASGGVWDSQNVNGTIAPSTPPTGQASLDVTPYTTQISTAAAYPATNQTFNNTTLSGTYYVNGGVTIGNITITGTATIIATGVVTVLNNSTIGDNLSVIAGSSLFIGNSVTIGQKNIWYSSAGISAGNSGDEGDVVVNGGSAFISPGMISLGNSTKFSGLIYCGSNLLVGNNADIDGLVIASNTAYFGNNASIALGPYLMNYNTIPGMDLVDGGALGGPRIISWQEI